MAGFSVIAAQVFRGFLQSLCANAGINKFGYRIYFREADCCSEG
jgi:hypothetical protein